MDNVNKDRIVKNFLELASIDSVSFQERKMADCIGEKLSALGIDYVEDNAGENYNGNAGNIYAYIPGKGEPVLFSAHMDTVKPGIGKKPILEADGEIHTDKTTVLGSDDVAGIVEILEGVQVILESHQEHRPIELLFPIGEEDYVKGTNVFDFSRIKSKEAYVLDMSGNVGSAAVKAPSLISFTITVEGVAAHAGFNPEAGVNAIALASKAISKIKQGHVDRETTLNIGTISGGTATNIISEMCVITGETRSYSHERAVEQIENLREVFEETVTAEGGKVLLEYEINLHAYDTGKDARAVKNFMTACEKLEMKGKLTSTFGGSDNNNFALHGIKGIVLSCGMQEVHSVNEHINVKDLVKGAELVKEIIQAT